MKRILQLFLCAILIAGFVAGIQARGVMPVVVLSTSRNWFGDGSEGTLSTGGNVNLSAVADGDMVVKNYVNLTINAGHTMTTDNRCKGLLIYVRGNCVIDGTLTMTARGAYADPVAAGVGANGIIWGMYRSGASNTVGPPEFRGCGQAAILAMANQPAVSDRGIAFQVKRAGAAGNTAGDGYQSGGGGNAYDPIGAYVPGAGAAGTCFSGGSGAGYKADCLVSCGEPYDGFANGGPGGNSSGATNGGGAGNPCGSGGGNCANGTGGLLILVVGGNLTIGATGIISADGAKGGDNSGGDGSGGGGSGGGNVVIAYAGALTNAGTIRANGGAKGTGFGDSQGDGTPGKAGSVQGPSKVDP